MYKLMMMILGLELLNGKKGSTPEGPSYRMVFET